MSAILEVSTTQLAAIKCLIKYISTTITQCNIKFVSAHDDKSGCMTIVKLSEDKTVLIKTNLVSNQFDSFVCLEPVILIGVNMNILYQSINKLNDKITFYLDKDDRTVLFVQDTHLSIPVPLIDLCEVTMPIPITMFDSKISISSRKFSKIHNKFTTDIQAVCNKMSLITGEMNYLCNSYADNLEMRAINMKLISVVTKFQTLANNYNHGIKISSVGNELNFTGPTHSIKLSSDSNKLEIRSPSDTREPQYDIKNLLNVCLCDTLCNTFELFMKQDFPLVIVISVATLGKLYVFIAPIE